MFNSIRWEYLLDPGSTTFNRSCRSLSFQKQMEQFTWVTQEFGKFIKFPNYASVDLWEGGRV